MTLTKTVTNILNKKVTEEQAKQFALDNYGILATYIRQQTIEGIMRERSKSKCIKVCKGVGDKFKGGKKYYKETLN
jgi:hypothetical protein